MANNTIKRVWNANKLVSIEDLSGMTFQGENEGHTFEVSGVDDSGSSVSISGTVTAVFLRADNAAISISGSVSSGKAVATLTQNCYTVPGRFLFTIFVAANSQKTAIYSATGNVARTDGVATGSVPPLVTDSIQTGSITASGDITVGGVLDVTNRRCYATLSSEGWYRIMTFNGSSDNDANGYAGSQIDFTIGRNNGANRPENHNIRFHLIAGVIKFDSEQSTSNVMCIDKIRYCSNGSNGYVDIHYSYSTQNIVFVNFTVCDQYSRQYRYVATNFTPAATSPVSPETVVTEYSFVANTDALFKTVTLSNQSISSGYFIYQDSSITVNSKLQISQYYKSGEGLGMFFVLQPRAGDVVVYCRTGSGDLPADESTISAFLTIDNR